MVPLLTSLLLGLAAPPLSITWDASLAFERDRKAYEARLEALVNDAHDTQSRAFGRPLPRGLSVVVHTPAAYEKTFGRARARAAAAHYARGAIHVNGGRRLDGRFSATMHHEMVHAFVDYRGTARFVPLWLNEGLAEAAEKFVRGSDDLAPSERQQLRLLARRDALPKLIARGQLSHLDYLVSWAAVLYIEHTGGPGAARRVVRAMTDDGKSFREALQRAGRVDANTFEETFAAWLRRR